MIEELCKQFELAGKQDGKVRIYKEQVDASKHKSIKVNQNVIKSLNKKVCLITFLLDSKRDMMRRSTKLNKLKKKSR